MRPIKFRAWDMVEGKMVFLHSLDFTMQRDAINATFSHKYDRGRLQERRDMEDFVLLQFTGLKDKNGKEIYEGDIVKHTYYPNKGLVEWMGYNPNKVWIGQYCLRDVGDEYIVIHQGNIEVIGNIYENSELLKP